MTSKRDQIEEFLDTIDYSGYEPQVDKESLKQALQTIRELREAVDTRKLERELRCFAEEDKDCEVYKAAQTLLNFVDGGE